MALRYSPLAVEDVREAADWYDGRVPGLGAEFRGELRARLDLVRQFSKSGEKIDGEVRRVLLARFPYAVFYEPSADAITVYAVIHTAQDEGAWLGRLP